jgi:hypothetical protein
VRRERHQVDAHRVDVEREQRRALHRVAVEEDALLPADRPDLGDRLEGADLVVGEHDRDEHRLVRDRVAELVEVDLPGAVDRKVRDARLPRPLEVPAGVEHGLVLGHLRDHVVALLAIELDHALDRQVVRLGRAARPDDVLRPRPDEPRHLLARGLHRLLGLPPEAVAPARRVPEDLGEVRQHGLEHARVDRRGRMVVHVDALGRHGCSSDDGTG